MLDLPQPGQRFFLMRGNHGRPRQAPRRCRGQTPSKGNQNGTLRKNRNSCRYRTTGQSHCRQSRQDLRSRRNTTTTTAASRRGRKSQNRRPRPRPRQHWGHSSPRGSSPGPSEQHERFPRRATPCPAKRQRQRHEHLGSRKQKTCQQSQQNRALSFCQA